MKRKFLVVLMIILLVVAFKSTSYATTVTSAFGVFSNTFGEHSSPYSIANVSNQTGLSEGFVSGETDWDTYFGRNPSHRADAVLEWWGNPSSPQTGSVIFDLGESYLVDKIALWNEEYLGIAAFDVLISNDGILFTSVGSSFSPTNWDNYPIYYADIFFLTPTIGRYIKLDITSPGITGYSVSMGEIVFSTSNSPVPEPSTMLLLGFGLVGLAGVARKKLKK